MSTFSPHPAWIRLRDVGATLLIAIVFALGSQHSSHAKEAELDRAMVKQFLASVPDVKAIAVRQATEGGGKIMASDNSIAALLQLASDDDARTEIEAAVQPYGFKGAKQWFQVAQAVSRAYIHIKVGPSESKAQQKLRKTIAKIEKNDFLSDKQKRKLVKAITDGADLALEPPPEQNIAAVKPMMKEIDAAVK